MTDDERRRLRNAFGTFMTGVTVATALDPDGRPIGFTANSFSSVSLDPPLLLVSIAKSSRNHAAVTTARGFAINVLAEDQKDVSNTFARPVEDRFAAVSWQAGPFGSPVLSGVCAWFDCALAQVVDTGDHSILIGRIEAFDLSERPGLGYWRGAYFTPSLEAAAAAPAADVRVGAVVTRDDRVLLVRDGAAGHRLPTARVGAGGLQGTLAGLLAGLGVSAEPGFVYSVYDDAATGRQTIVLLCNAAETGASEGFSTLDPAVLAAVSDPAERILLERFAAETSVGNYGVYFGTATAGEVRPLGTRSMA